MTLIDELYEKCKCFDHVTPVLVMKMAKRNFEASKLICDKILKMRQDEDWKKIQERYFKRLLEKDGLT